MGTQPSEQWTVSVGDHRTSAIWTVAGAGESQAVLILAHGAGGHMAHRTTVGLAGACHAAGLDVVRFNFLYRAAGSGPPDRMPKLKHCYAAVIDAVRARTGSRRLLIGGHSMGGRVASMLAADGLPCDGVLLLAYPLHPAGKPQQLRDAHLPNIKPPVMCINGTRDKLCDQNLMNQVVSRLGRNWTMHWVDGADHSFGVLKRSGRTAADVLDEIAAAIGRWSARIPQS